MLKSLLVKDYMTKSLVTFHPDTDILKAIHFLNENRISGAPVTDEHGNLAGMLSEKDCLKVALHSSYHEDWMGGRVSEYMTPKVETVSADDSIVDLAEKFLSSVYKRFPVLDDNNHLVGQISRSDVLKALEILW